KFNDIISGACQFYDQFVFEAFHRNFSRKFGRVNSHSIDESPAPHLRVQLRIFPADGIETAGKNCPLAENIFGKTVVLPVFERHGSGNKSEVVPAESSGVLTGF